jgi:glutamate-1-semialdehyde aminotransferase
VKTTGESQKLYRRAKQVIPGGTQLLSKRPEMFLPELWPAYYDRAVGCEVWDLDGNRYLDMSYMGLGAAILGYADPDVNAAVIRAVERSAMCTLNAPEEVVLAELLLELHPWSEMVRYARTGGEAMAIAMRIARAHTGKDVVLFSGYHGWHDWYLSANLADDRALDGHLLPGLDPRGVPRSLKGGAFPFAGNDLAAFLALMERHGADAACVVMEPVRNAEPDAAFLDAVRRETRKRGIPLIIDEITAGWRLAPGGAHLRFGIEPDMAIFGKGLGNGHAMAAVIGTRACMEVAQETFISSTYWTERIGPAAALATIHKLRAEDVPRHLSEIGKSVQAGWKAAAEAAGLKISIAGIAPLGHFSFDHAEPLVMKTLFTQLMLERGFLATTAFYASWAHRKNEVRLYLEAVSEAFRFMAKAVSEGNPGRHLAGPVCHAGFKRLT